MTTHCKNKSLKLLVAVAVTALFFVSLPAIAGETPVPLPCDPVDCGPVPNPLPGCPTCTTKPAPDITK